MGRILLCDDEVKLTRMLASALTTAGHSTERVATGREAIELCSREAFDILVTDLRLPDTDGLEVVRRVRQVCPETDVMVITAHATTETAVEAMRLGAYDYLVKPFSLDEFRMRIAKLLGRRELQARAGQLADQLSNLHNPENIVGSSARMREVLEQVRQVARTDATVLLLGESGTGKTLLARTIHYQSRRRSGPLCELHCAALPETLLESELFGHERGAFTGASEQRIGHVERSHRGTLFLDEIGEISPAIQAKLLRFLQDRQFFRVGSTQVRTVDVRFVLATNRDLQQAVRDRAFREDLFYRINVFPIHLPPLRERIEDVPALCAHILSRHRARLSEEAMELILRYSWPGNVRELENVLERAVILAGGTGEATILRRHLPAALTGAPTAPSPGSLLVPGFSIDGLERALIREALARASGNKSEAARLLGITRRRLYSRLKSMEADEASEQAEVSDRQDPGPSG
ncbi:MAG: sigma-54 dependent transcriptional regulator [Myxococcales bacterium]|nr:sigma-54 dependent transcriptional regulator [Myxococcota bacterium]MDW8280151.1 sigma-54 dependent transcriptional regulator [Myxococcales bacterium]